MIFLIGCSAHTFNEIYFYVFYQEYDFFFFKVWVWNSLEILFLQTVIYYNTSRSLAYVWMFQKVICF